MDSEFGNTNHQMYKQVDSDCSEEDKLYFSIRLSQYPHPLQLILTFDNYKQQFINFIRNYKLTRSQSLSLKQIVRTRISQELLKQFTTNQSSQIVQTQTQKQPIYQHPQKNVYFEPRNPLKSNQNKYTENAREKTTNDQASRCSNLQAHQENPKITNFKSYSKKLFDTQLNTQPNQQYHNNYPIQQYHKLRSFNSPISSIHSKSDQRSSDSYDMQGKTSQKRYENDSKSQQNVSNNHKYIQTPLNYQHHVSFNDLYGKNLANNQQEDFQGVPKGVNRVNVYKEVLMDQAQINKHLLQNYFILNPAKNHDTRRCFQSNQSSPKIKGQSQLTPQKNKPLINWQNKGCQNPGIVKKAKTKQIPQSTKVQPMQYNKSSSMDRNILTKSAQKPPNKYTDKSPNSTTKKQKQVIREIFYRLHRKETASSVQRQKPETKSKHPQQEQDQRVVNESLMSQRKKYINMGEQERQQLFTKLFLTSTESSMNRQNRCKNFSNYSNQIQHIINQSNKKQQQKNSPNKKCQFKNQLSINKKVKRSDLSSPVYGFKEKRCNAHCQQHEYEMKLFKEAQMKRLRELEIKQKVRSRSKSQYSSSKSLSKTKERTKIFGQCQCCHKHKIDDQNQRKESKRKKDYKRSYNCKTKYSLQKKFLPSNISFIQDVLEQSYNQLFPSNSNK